MEELVHGDAELFVVAIDGGPTGGFASAAGAADAGQDGADDVVAQCDEPGDDPSLFGCDVVAVGAAELVDEVFGSQLSQVVGESPWVWWRLGWLVF